MIAINLAAMVILTSCVPTQPAILPTPEMSEIATNVKETSTPTPLPIRPVYQPGTKVEYVAQTGDTLDAVAAHFNTTLNEVLDANPTLNAETTTLFPGEVYSIPIYYEALWGNPFHVLPDSDYVFGPSGIGFDTRAFVDASPGWLKNYSELAGKETRRGGDLIDYLAISYSIDPRLLLAIAEYQSGAISNPVPPEKVKQYTLGVESQEHKGFYLQLDWAANALNDGYYAWRRGSLDTITRLDGTIEHPDPWQNAATVAIQNYFARVLPIDQYIQSISVEGLFATYSRLFGDPWATKIDHIPGDLHQPLLGLPFIAGKTWSYTGGPHSAWGNGEPLAAIDFGPPSVVGGCVSSVEFVTAVADGQVVRSEPAIVVLDLDKDGDERTGWVIVYLHIGSNDKVHPGIIVKQGDPLGHPSCDGGSIKVTGTHVHISRKYNGEWILADSAMPFNLDGWITRNGTEPYLGTIRKFGRIVEASRYSDLASHITGGQ